MGIKGEDVRKVPCSPSWQVTKTGGSKVGKSPGLDEKQERYIFLLDWQVEGA